MTDPVDGEDGSGESPIDPGKVGGGATAEENDLTGGSIQSTVETAHQDIEEIAEAAAAFIDAFEVNFEEDIEDLDDEI
ncbi:MAG: hypothetical protein R2849_15460 [Thermomicrobiales bacterium]